MIIIIIITTTTITMAWLSHRDHLRTASGRTCRRLAFTFGILLMTTWIPSTFGQNLTASANQSCEAFADGNYGRSRFNVRNWVRRGNCVREKIRGMSCHDRLEPVLRNLSEVRRSEYGGAAGVLSLLPTIGALLGAPTNEIWRLMSIIPFGGGLAMALSFGGAIMPVNVADSEHVTNKRHMAIGSIISLGNDYGPGQGAREKINQKLRLLVDRVRLRIDQRESARLSKWHLITGLVGMLVLLCGAQVAITVVEFGGVVGWICSNRLWMHMWYSMGESDKSSSHWASADLPVFFSVTLTAVVENWVQLPFIQTYKLYISSVAYNISTTGGESVIDCFKAGDAGDNVAIALHQLSTLKAGTLTIHGSRQWVRSRNSVMIMVSIVGDSRIRKMVRLVAKSISIAVFVAGTACFASVTLLSLQMAIMVLTLSLSAGIFGRALAGWVVSRVSDTEPMIHVISNTRHEAYQAVAEILSIRSDDGTPFQVEVNGHIFIDQRRVAKRSRWPVRAFLGVLAEPYDLRKACRPVTSPAEDASPFLGSEVNLTWMQSRGLVAEGNLRSRENMAPVTVTTP